MSITASNIIPLSLGNQVGVIADLTISDTYAEGGIHMDALEMFGLNTVNKAIFDGAGGLDLQFDYTNEKIKMYNPNVPLIVYEEYQSCPAGSYVITLNYPAAYIMNVAKPGQNLAMRSTGVTPGSNQCSLAAQLAAGVRSQITLGTTTLLANGTFTGNATGWTPEAAAWTYGANVVAKDANGTGTLAEDAFAATIGETYELTYTISGWTVGTVTPTVGGVAGTAVGADGTYTERFTATTVGPLLFTPTDAARFSIDNVILTQMAAKVTYVTQAWKDVWDNLVQDEAITLATGANTLTSGNKILALMYMDQITATAAALVPVDEDDTVGSGEMEVAFNVATGQLTAHADQNAKAAKITYVKIPASGFLKDRLFHNEGATHAGSDPYTDTFDYPILIWGYAGYAPANGQTTQVLIDYAGTPAAGEAVVDWYAPGSRGGGAPAVGTVVGLKSNITTTGAGVWGRLDEVPFRQPLEMMNGTSVSLTTRVLLIGY